jgi:hypothetical protein
MNIALRHTPAAEAPWMQTRSGRKFPLIDPRPEHVYWPDIIYALSHINRFGGHVGHYSVAQHSMLVASALLPEWRPYGLLHDAHEAFVGDVPTPLKVALGNNQRTGLGGIARAIDRAVFEAAGLCWPMPTEIKEAVHYADMRALMTERRDLMVVPPDTWGGNYEEVRPLPEPIVRWTTQQTIARFAGALAGCGLTVAPISFTD